MREEKFKMERQGLIQVGDKVKIFRIFVSHQLQLHHRTGCCHVRLL